MAETFKKSDGRSVVAADNAETIGEVKGFVVDVAASRVESVYVSGRGKKSEVIPWTAITSFGGDAVMAESAASAKRVSGEHEIEAVEGSVAALDARVLDSDGFEQGTVEDVMFDAETGQLTGALTTEGHISSSKFLALGSYALIIEAG